ncbi:unnamed protein product [Clonostachys solani]|uniref:Major facilitator superfamily (MFS) profile domain-containing protein n=1 Tax=Clonostachys solani TaxID=160281 RepID=A0A9P0EML5_9HYPO|nr:unnamed protein product [Clonostachys solani]
MSDLFTEKAAEERQKTPATNGSDTEVVADSFSEKAEHVTDEQSSDEQYPQGLKFIALTGASISAVFLIALDQTSAGKIYKFFNLKWTFLWSMLIFEVGSLICGVAPTSKALVAGRAIAGLGGAGLSVGGTSIISLTVPPLKRPLMMGIIGMTYCLSAVLGPLLGGAFTESVTWRWCFYINLPIGGLAAAAVVFFFNLPAAAAPPPATWKEKLLHIDLVGVALVMGAITCFILGLQYGGITHPWKSSVVIGLLVGFGLLSIALITWEIWIGDYAMMMPRLYRRRSLSATAPFQFFFMGSYIVLLYYLPLYFQSILGVSPIQSGVNNLPLMASAAVFFALLGGIVVMKTGRAQQVMMIGSMITTAAIGLIYTLDIGTSTARWAGYQVFVGSVMSFAIMHGLAVAQADVGPEDLAAVTANLLFFQTIGGAFSTSIGQSAFVNRLLIALPETAPGVDPSLVLFTGASDLQHVFPEEVLPGVLKAYMVGLKAAFAVAIAFCGCAFLASLAIPMKKLPSHEPGEGPVAMA